MSSKHAAANWSMSRYGHGKDFVREVKPPKAHTRQNGTSHCIVTVDVGPFAGESMPVPMHELGKGLSAKIFKWFVRVGLLVALILAYYVTYG